MNAEEEKLIRILEARVTQITLEFKALQHQYELLHRTTEEKTKTIETLTARIEELQTDYANLKIAKMIEISEQDMKNAKSKLSRLVREVDKCIALLNA